MLRLTMSIFMFPSSRMITPAKGPMPGATVIADPDSPTGHSVTFVYYHPNATRVQLAGDLTLLDIHTGTTRYPPEAWQTGRYHCGGAEFLREMTQDADGYWSAAIPMHAGGLSYWYRVWDPAQGWSNQRIWDPAAAHPRPEGHTSFRSRNNDVLGAVYVPYDEKQNDPVLENRAKYELPVTDPAQRGTVQYIPYTTILGNDGHYLGVYLPAGYDANRTEPYQVIYLAHGIFGDETDFLIPGNVPNILDNMIARGEIEPVVVVTMGNHFTGARLDFGSYDRTNAANNLVQTILPLIEAKYHVSKEREGRVYAGFSYGGMTGGFVIRAYPTTFRLYGFFSGNPSLTAEDYDAIAAAVGTNNLSIFLGNGFFEGNLDAANTIRDNFRNRGISAETAQVRGAHDMMTASQLFTIFARDYL
jgi:enterochelin esterase-like enzyme